MLEIRMILCQFCSALGLGTERIDPGMKLHTTGMALLDHPLQRVPIRIWRCSLTTGEITAPRLETALIKGIGFWTHLKQNGIDTTFLQLIELIGQLRLHTGCTHTLELVIHTLNPRTAKFAFGRDLRMKRQGPYTPQGQ